MTNPYRALCAELLVLAEESISYRAQVSEAVNLIDRARALLAQPEPEGPTDEDLEPSSVQLSQLQSGLLHCYSKASAREYLRVWIRDYARAALAADCAVLARYGTPANTINQED